MTPDLEIPPFVSFCRLPIISHLAAFAMKGKVVPHSINEQSVRSWSWSLN